MDLDYTKKKKEKLLPLGLPALFLHVYKSLLVSSFLFWGSLKIYAHSQISNTECFSSTDHAQTSAWSLTFRVGVIDILRIVAQGVI